MPYGDWSFPDPLPVPGVPPDDPPFHTVQFNELWLAYIIGALENLQRPSMWEGTDAEIDEVLSQIDELIAMFAAGYECP